MKNKLLHRGFTLIELLIVMAIIGILSSLMVVNLTGFRERTRDSQRKRDLLQIQTALELYRADVGSYPAAPLPACNSALVNGTATYMRRVPCDPRTATRYDYQRATTTTYVLSACLENANDVGENTRTTTPVAGWSCSPSKYFVLYSP